MSHLYKKNFQLARVELTVAGDTMHPNMPTTIYVDEDHLKTYTECNYIYYKTSLSDTADLYLAKAHVASLIFVTSRKSYDFGNKRAISLGPGKKVTEGIYLDSAMEEIGKIAEETTSKFEKIGAPYTGSFADDDTSEILLDGIIVEEEEEKKKDDDPPKFIKMRIGKAKENLTNDSQSQQ